MKKSGMNRYSKKKSGKKKWIILAVVIVIAVIFCAGVYINYLSEISQMSALETGEINPGIFSVNDEFVNLYLVKGQDGYIAIDAGNKKENVQNELKKLKIDAAQVKAVFLTHSDGDHIGALGLFGKARVFISSDEEQMVNGRTARFISTIKNSLPTKYEKVRDNQTIEIAGITIRGIMTPGHTPGSMCYMVNGRHLFVGDTMSLKAGKADLFNKSFNMDSETQKKSLHKLRNIPGIKFIYTAHYGAVEDQGTCFVSW